MYSKTLLEKREVSINYNRIFLWGLVLWNQKLIRKCYRLNFLGILFAKKDSLEHSFSRKNSIKEDPKGQRSPIYWCPFLEPNVAKSDSNNQDFCQLKINYLYLTVYSVKLPYYWVKLHINLDLSYCLTMLAMCNSYS